MSEEAAVKANKDAAKAVDKKRSGDIGSLLKESSKVVANKKPVTKPKNTLMNFFKK